MLLLFLWGGTSEKAHFYEIDHYSSLVHIHVQTFKPTRTVKPQLTDL